MTHRWIRLCSPTTGAAIFTAGFTGPCDAWGWILDKMREEHGAHEDDVGCAESEDGDLVTVSGEALYVIRHGLPN